MPSLSLYDQILGRRMHEGLSRKNESDYIMDETWWEDINSRIGYLYDYYHDDEPFKLRNLHPIGSKTKQPIDIKFLQSSSQTYAKDQVTFHIQLRPFQYCNVDYYPEVFEKRYEAIFPIGLYIDIEDETGQYNRWLIVDKANMYATQFPTFEVLPCDKVIQYIHNGIKYQIPGVLRSQNSYNSGIWRDNLITTIEDQQKFVVPLNRDTEFIYYNLRMIIDANVLSEPRAWRVTKVNRITPKGISNVTLAQDVFDQNKDYVEFDENRNIIGMWADYYSSDIVPKDFSNEETSTNVYSKISFSGTKPTIKVNGSYKKFAVTFYLNEEIDEYHDTEWKLFIDDEDVTSQFSILTSESSSDLQVNQIKVKAPNDYSYIGKVLTIKTISTDGIESSVEVDIVAL